MLSSSKQHGHQHRIAGEQNADNSQAVPASRSSPKRATNTRVVQLLKRPRTVVNHSYVDYSLVPFEPTENMLPPLVKDMDFHQKIHHILSRTETQEVAGWLPHGRAFRIFNPSQFETKVCPVYFQNNRYSTFLHQLGVHGYKLLFRGHNKNAYYSQVRERCHLTLTICLFAWIRASSHILSVPLYNHSKLCLRGLPHLTKYMPPPQKIFRRMSNDIENEPDFHLIQLIAPLPDDARYGKPLTIEDIVQFCKETGRDERRVMNQFHVLLMNRDNEMLMHRLR